MLGNGSSILLQRGRGPVVRLFLLFALAALGVRDQAYAQFTEGFNTYDLLEAKSLLGELS